jgi:diacylglycerol kinase family enzyme
LEVYAAGEPFGRPARAARWWAILSLAAGLALALVLVVFLVRNGIFLVVGLVGLALSLVGGWWVVAERMPRRAVGFLALLLGAVVQVVALLRAGNEDLTSLLLLIVALGLLAGAVLAAQAALDSYLRRTGVADVQHAPRPRHAVLLCNPWSGGGKVEQFGLVGQANSLGVETVLLDHGLDLEALARGAVADGADCLGMAGGDGSQALVASIAVQHDLPFVCVSAGTRNHFALDLGLDRRDPCQSLHAFTDAVERRVDYATVNGRFFVNNVSLGAYAAIVQQEGYRDAKAETTGRLLPDMLGQHTEPFDLQFVTPDGREVDGCFLIMVSNNPYVLGPSLDVSQRRRLDSGRLGVFAVSARTGAQTAEVVTLALVGKGSASGSGFQFECDTFEVRSRSGRAYAGVDGEALELQTPLVFRIHPGGLRLLVPEGNVDAAVRRQAREVHVRDLMSLATSGSAPVREATS